MLTRLVAHATSMQIGAIAALLASLGLAWRVPLLGDRYFGKIEHFGTRLAARKGLAMGAIAAAPRF